MAEFWQPEPPKLSDDHMVERRVSERSSLANPGLIWRHWSPEEPIAVRLLNKSAHGVAFVCPLPMEPGERFELAIEQDAERRTLCVANCEHLATDTYRIGAHA